MIYEHWPFIIKNAYLKLERCYTQYRIAPHFKSLGSNSMMMKPWYIDIHGGFIEAGNNLHVITARDRRVILSTWQFEDYQGHITLGDNCLICPGVRFNSGSSINVGNNCMFAAGSYITDADWHDIYDRTKTIGTTAPITLADNVWIGDGAIVCKGVSIGENSVIGAGAVVASDIPANCIAAGNPARVIKQLDPERTLVTRAQIFEDVGGLNTMLENVNRKILANNTLWGWLRTILRPRRGD
ncbi:MAG: acyltransferase [Pseudomonadales bacterium]|nr:acyltransferase [Pseudomonadales bacterium]